MNKEPVSFCCLSLFSGLIFVFDISMPQGVASGMLYIFVIAICVFLRSIKLIIFFSIISILLIIVGYFLSEAGSEKWIELINRAESIVMLGLIAGIGILLLKKQFKIEAELRHIANIDPLTAIANRRYILAFLEDVFHIALHFETELSILLLDIDHFKAVNDQNGHDVGDEVLRRVIAACLPILRKSDMIGRFGGEEFLVVCPHTSLKDCLTIGEKLRDTVERIDLSDLSSTLCITISVGCAGKVKNQNDIGLLIKKADDALYHAKHAGRNQIQVA